MEIIKKAQFISDFYGGKSYLPGNEVVKNWLDAQGDRLLHPRMKELKDALSNEVKLEEILSVFNTNEKDEPIIGDWMLLESSINAQKLAGTWMRFEVSAETWRNSVQFNPHYVKLRRNGGFIKQADSVECYPVKPKGKPSFFKAYQVINTGARFDFSVLFPEDLCVKTEGKGKAKQILPDVEKSAECVEAVLQKMGIIGLGAYRLRFGKFKYV